MSLKNLVTTKTYTLFTPHINQEKYKPLRHNGPKKLKSSTFIINNTSVGLHNRNQPYSPSNQRKTLVQSYIKLLILKLNLINLINRAKFL